VCDRWKAVCAAGGHQSAARKNRRADARERFLEAARGKAGLPSARRCSTAITSCLCRSSALPWRSAGAASTTSLLQFRRAILRSCHAGRAAPGASPRRVAHAAVPAGWRGEQDRLRSRQDADERMGIEAVYRRPENVESCIRPQDLPISAARLGHWSGPTRSGRQISPTSRWRAASSISPPSWTGCAPDPGLAADAGC
jgi:hypothetical protein